MIVIAHVLKNKTDVLRITTHGEEPRRRKRHKKQVEELIQDSDNDNGNFRFYLNIYWILSMMFRFH